jgi:tetratricopeptide (TPR) repeat protein
MRSIASLQWALLLGAPLLPGAGPAAVGNWIDTRGEIAELADAGDADAAADLGDRHIEEVRAEFGETGPELPAALLQLADLYLDIGEPAAAAERILEAIAILAPGEATDSPALMNALIALGDAYAADSLNALAIEAFGQAREISRRRLGLHNLDQVGILYRMSRAALDDGDIAAAADYRQDARDLFVRARLEDLRDAPGMRSSDEAEFLDARLAYATALIEEGMVQDASIFYGETLDIIDEEFDNDSEMRAEVLLAQSAAVGASLPVLQRARRTINFMAEPDVELRAALRREWGDWRMLVGLHEKAERAYRSSWKLLAGLEGGAELQREWFGEPEFIRDARNGLLNAGVLTIDPEAPVGEVALQFVIDPTGRAQRISVASANPEWMIGVAVSQVQSSLFRPRFIDGELVDTPGQFVWRFRYDPVVAARLGLMPVPPP